MVQQLRDSAMEQRRWVRVGGGDSGKGGAVVAVLQSSRFWWWCSGDDGGRDGVRWRRGEVCGGSKVVTGAGRR